MSGTPSFFAETPSRQPAKPDVLSNMLETVRLTGAVFLNARFTAPYGIMTSNAFDPGIPMSHLRHTSIFHFIAAGSCCIETASGDRRDVSAGDLLLIPFAASHKMWSGDSASLVRADDVVRQCADNGVWRIDHGGGGDETRIVCGFIESSEFLFAPIFRTLPEIIIERGDGDAVGSLLSATVQRMVSLSEAATPGTQLALGRMMEMLFVEMLRRHASRLPEGSAGWFAALNDPVVSRALDLLHADPARRWTADELAREAATSRTVLAERFNAILGRPPIDYLTGLRIQLAANRLRSSAESIAAISLAVGYESEPAFNRAFKRITGMTPGRWRAGGGEIPALMPLQYKQKMFAR
jgi:AraC-like DNA-binding protein